MMMRGRMRKQRRNLKMSNSKMFYTVEYGDTLNEIAQRHGTSTEQLQKINGIKNVNHIEVGQIIALSPRAVCKVSVQILDRDLHPIVNAKVSMEYSGKKKELSSDHNGRLPAILTKTPEDRVKIFIARVDGSWKHITDVVSGWGNKIVTLVSPKIRVDGKTMPHPKDASGKPIRDKGTVKPPVKSKINKTKEKPEWSYGDGKGPKSKQTKDSKGLPIQEVSNKPRTIVTPEDGLVPWMKYALAEAKRFKGADERVIEKSINYHKENKAGLPNMHEDRYAWCASFANWCIRKAGYPIVNPRELGLEDRKTFADGFRQVHKGKRLVSNPLFVQIPEPVYGAIAVVTLPKGVRPERPGKHVGFVYGRSSKNKICVLGGNQGNTIKFSDYIEKEITQTVNKIDKKTKQKKSVQKKSNHLEFYLPTAYYPIYAKSSKTLSQVNTFNINNSYNIKPESANL
jgi:uncharacterized protein (TIGR02594 family)